MLRVSALRAKLLVAVFLLFLAGLALSAYLAVTVGNELYEARAALTGRASDLDRASLLSAREHLVAADEKLDGPAATVASLVPVLGHSVRAVEDVTEAALGVVDAADVLTRKLDAVRALQVIENGRVRLDLLAQLRGPLQDQAEALRALSGAARAGRNGWIPPPLWDALDDLEGRVSGYLEGAEKGTEALRLMGPMLGQEGPRSYLVVLLNNAELRGAGGIPSAAGTLRAVEGTLSLGTFRHTAQLRGPPPNDKVAAPADFRRRFGRYGADTTLWTNTTFSPDVPDVGVVAARLYRKVTKEKVDGVLLIDPRGVAALMPADAEVRVRGTGAILGREEVAEYAYSTVYGELGGANRGRRRALLHLGKAAFESILQGGTIAGQDTLEEAGAAVAAGHLRLVSLEPDEQTALTALGASGDLGAAPGDSLLVATQNFSQDKLDYWTHRRIRHRCRVDDEGASCKTSVVLVNRAPKELTRYVAGRPYGALESLVEVYVPEDATVGDTELEGDESSVYDERQDGHTIAGGLLEVRPGERKAFSVSYHLPLDEGRYSLEVIPQPLARDARVDVSLEVPASWVLRGEGDVEPGGLEFSGELDRTLEFSAEPRDRTGISSLWDGLVRFWREPLF